MSAGNVGALTLDEHHVYRLGERIIPSVTQIIGAVLRPQFYGATDWHMERGTALHAAINLDADKLLDRDSIDPAIAGRFSAYEKFMHDSHAKAEASEIMLYSERYCFAGTIDRINRYTAGALGVTDWKSSASPTDELQVGGYSILCKEAGDDLDEDFFSVVTLNDDGTYRVNWIRNIKRAERRFLACLTVYNFMAEAGLLPKGEQQ